jgi:hypothetical protein
MLRDVVKGVEHRRPASSFPPKRPAVTIDMLLAINEGCDRNVGLECCVRAVANLANYVAARF